MFRFFKYDETGYTDFPNTIFSNLDSSRFDTENDKVSIDNIEYRISTIKEICDNCNNSETLSNETMTRRYPLRTITTPGAKGTVPATNDHTDGSWSPTDLYNGEVLINTTDHYAYIRSGNEIRSWQLVPVIENTPLSFEFIDPDNITVGNPPVEVMFYGSGLEQISGVEIDSLQFGVTVSDFQVINNSQIYLIIDPSEADLQGSSGEILEIPFITISGETVKASMHILSESIPQGDPVIELIEPYGSPYFMAGEQTVLITGSNLNAREGLSINPGNDLITILSFEFDDNNNIMAQTDIPVELLNTHVDFVLSYDGYMTEPYQVYLSKEETPPPPILSIVSVPGGVTTGAITFNISISQDINELELVEVQSEFNVNIGSYSYVGPAVVEVNMDTTQMNYGETFRLRVTADGQTSDWSQEIIIM